MENTRRSIPRISGGFGATKKVAKPLCVRRRSRAGMGRRQLRGQRGGEFVEPRNDPIRGTATGEHGTVCGARPPVGVDGREGCRRLPGQRGGSKFAELRNDPIRGTATIACATSARPGRRPAWTAPGWVAGGRQAGAAGANSQSCATTLYGVLRPSSTAGSARRGFRSAWTARDGSPEVAKPGRWGEFAELRNDPIGGTATVERGTLCAAWPSVGMDRTEKGCRGLPGQRGGGEFAELRNDPIGGSATVERGSFCAAWQSVGMDRAGKGCQASVAAANSRSCATTL